MLLLKDEAAPSTQSPTEPAEPSGATNKQPEVSTAANNYRAALLRWSEVAHPYETSRERYGRIRGELQERMHRAGLTGPIDDHAVTVEMRREDALRAERSREERERHRELREVQERRRELCQQTSGPEHGMRDYREALLSTIMHPAARGVAGRPMGNAEPHVDTNSHTRRV